MQLAVEEQELQKAAAVKQGETTADEIQRQCISLLEVLYLVLICCTILRMHLYSII